MTGLNQTTAEEHPVSCWHCLAEFDAVISVWCSCSAGEPNKLCPFCLSCLCHAQPDVVDAFWRDAPPGLRAEREGFLDRRLLLGDMLVASGRLTTGQLLTALERQRATGARLGACLVEEDLLSEEELHAFLAQQRAPVSFDLDSLAVSPDLVRRVGVESCFEHRILPVDLETVAGQRVLMLAMADPSDGRAIALAGRRTHARVVAGYTPERTLLRVLSELFPTQAPGETLGTGAPDPAEALLLQALRCRATHFHLEVRPAGARLAFRVDGRMHRVRQAAGLETTHVEALRAWFKAHARGKTALLERDGERRILEMTFGRTARSMSASVRLDDPGLALTALEGPGVAQARAAIRQQAEQNRGLILLAGPAHHETRQTVWGLVNLVAGPTRPVEVRGGAMRHPEPWVYDAGQAPAAAPLFVHRTQGLDELHDLLDSSRQRLVGVRLLRAHAAGAAAVLHDLDGETVRSSLTLMLTQRAVARICDQCFTPVTVPTTDLKAAGLTDHEAHDLNLFKGEGCDSCSVSPGFRGREVILHARVVDDAFREALTADPHTALRQAARETARGLRLICLDLLRQGLTTLDEFRNLRV